MGCCERPFRYVDVLSESQERATSAMYANNRALLPIVDDVTHVYIYIYIYTSVRPSVVVTSLGIFPVVQIHGARSSSTDAGGSFGDSKTK